MKAKPKKKGPGQPTKFRESYIEESRRVCAATGATDKELARLFKVNEQRINYWKNAHPKFKEALQEGKDKYDSEVIEVALRKRALGYEYAERKEETDGETGTKWTITTKHQPPDTAACRYFLNNRSPKRWKDKHELDLGSDGLIVQIRDQAEPVNDEGVEPTE